ncbi:MAG TPA: arginine--tRNA ligase [Nitrososphaerales archaeon]|nr:arginine--tRNA ligase [Nitrososphaerales archaeon]
MATARGRGHLLKFREFEAEVRDALVAAAKERGYQLGEVELLRPPNPELGDVSSPVGLRLAREAKKAPGVIARELAETIDASATWRLIGGVEAHDSGYVNFRTNWGLFAHELLESVLRPEGGVLQLDAPGARKRVAIEHTNVNPNKALHIGHARNLVLGDSLVRTMKRLGHEVQTLNYIDDSGAQVADVIVGLRFLHISDEAPEGVKFDAYCGDVVYTKVNQVYERDPSLKEKQRLVLKEIERGSGEISEYSEKIVSQILAAQLQTCWRLGARYDLLNWESHILRTGMWNEVFEELKSKGIAVLETEGENAGCWVVKDKELGDDKVLVRSDGTVVYVAKDIPYAAWKIGLVGDQFSYRVYGTQPDGSTLWSTTAKRSSGPEAGAPPHPRFGGADLAISVIDSKQSRLQKVVSRVLERLEGKESERYMHRAYEVVALSKKSAESLGLTVEKEFVHMQGRKGIYINVDTVLDALKSKSAEETKRRNPDRSDEWVASVADVLAVAAFRFELVKQDPDKMIAFDLESSLRLQGDTGPYLLYSYARASRILVKSGATGPTTSEASARKLTHPKEVALLKLISTYDKSVMEAERYLSPKEVATYAHSLAATFSEFYEAVQVNSEPDASLREARLAMIEGFRVILKDALGLLGIQALEEI